MISPPLLLLLVSPLVLSLPPPPSTLLSRGGSTTSSYRPSPPIHFSSADETGEEEEEGFGFAPDEDEVGSCVGGGYDDGDYGDNYVDEIKPRETTRGFQRVAASDKSGWTSEEEDDDSETSDLDGARPNAPLQELLALGYTQVEAGLMKASVAEVVVEKQLERPASGMPKEWYETERKEGRVWKGVGRGFGRVWRVGKTVVMKVGVPILLAGVAGAAVQSGRAQFPRATMTNSFKGPNVPSFAPSLKTTAPALQAVSTDIQATLEALEKLRTDTESTLESPLESATESPLFDVLTNIPVVVRDLDDTWIDRIVSSFLETVNNVFGKSAF